jgi:hypothetical protein
VKDKTPFPSHLGPEFLLWLWATSSGDERIATSIGAVDVWVEDRLAFRAAGGESPVVVVTAENSARDTAAFAALHAGRVIQQMRIGLRRDDREYALTLDDELNVRQLKMPTTLSESVEEAVLDRMHLVNEVDLMVQGLFKVFARQRRSVPIFREGLTAWLEAA